MRSISTLVIGAGQAGLAMSHCLSRQGIGHVVLEKAEIANAWRNQRWDSLRLLTPNWQNDLPGGLPNVAAPDGFATAEDFAAGLRDYARSIGAPVEERCEVSSVRAAGNGYEVRTNRGDWYCRSLILASGVNSRPYMPPFAREISAGIRQITAHDYKNPQQIAPGGVLVVGGSASGVQLASEISAAGHEVTLSIGEHIRVPRFYRGHDIQLWMDRTGLHAQPASLVADIDRARRVPSFQLIGSAAERFLDLNSLQDQGVEIVGRLASIQDGAALFSGSLANHCMLSDLKMNRLLDTIDAWISERGLALPVPAERFAPTRVPRAPRLSEALGSGRFRTIVWATGYVPDYSWLDLPVLDRKGRLIHDKGAVAPNLYALGLPFMRRRDSSLIGGAGRDATEIAQILDQTSRRKAG
ncbi:MAG: NAD(P)-binding domain-containing protein [Rhizobiaceae bacterium]|nr:NAD(P)-binding domain-containing protein [Rhizobiaceae bacterium]